MKLKHLESALQRLQSFETPEVSFEQYATTPHIGAHMLHIIESEYGDISDKLIVDLGCGCGILTIGASLLGASFCIGLDIDDKALGICKENVQEAELENIDVLQYNLLHPLPSKLHNAFDVAIMNPPFGTKNNEGIDMIFVEKALSMANVVYSLHKTASRKRIKNRSKKLDINMKPIAQIHFDIKNSYKFHRQDSVDVEVDLIRFYKCSL